MKIIDHGYWVLYKPTDFSAWKSPPPRGALFCKRESDGVDWYKYSHPTEDDQKLNRLGSQNFREDSVKIAFMWHEVEKQWIIGPSTTDVSLIFPQNMRVRELIDTGLTDEDEIIARYRNKVVDPKTTELLGDRSLFAPPVMDVMKTLEDVIARLEKLEKRR